MRRLNRYCLDRQQIKMSWNPRNCFNILQRGPINERHMNIFQLEWKSKALCRLYFNGDVTERVFKAAFNSQGRNIYRTLEENERRVDNALFRCMFAPSVFEARKMTSSGKVLVNGERIWTPSHRLRDGDIIQILPFWSKSVYRLVNHPMIRIWSFIPEYLEVNHANLSACFLRSPKYEEIPNPYPRFMIDNMGAFYSKRG